MLVDKSHTVLGKPMAARLDELFQLLRSFPPSFWQCTDLKAPVLIDVLIFVLIIFKDATRLLFVSTKEKHSS